MSSADHAYCLSRKRVAETRSRSCTGSGPAALRQSPLWITTLLI